MSCGEETRGKRQKNAEYMGPGTRDQEQGTSNWDLRIMLWSRPCSSGWTLICLFKLLDVIRWTFQNASVESSQTVWSVGFERKRFHIVIQPARAGSLMLRHSTGLDLCRRSGMHDSSQTTGPSNKGRPEIKRGGLRHGFPESRIPTNWAIFNWEGPIFAKISEKERILT